MRDKSMLVGLTNWPFRPEPTDLDVLSPSVEELHAMVAALADRDQPLSGATVATPPPPSPGR
jgi:hypothetical protein